MADTDIDAIRKQKRAERNHYTYNFYLVVEALYFLPTNLCDMYMSCLRHIHDPVLLSQDRNYTFLQSH